MLLLLLLICKTLQGGVLRGDMKDILLLDVRRSLWA